MGGGGLGEGNRGWGWEGGLGGEGGNPVRGFDSRRYYRRSYVGGGEGGLHHVGNKIQKVLNRLKSSNLSDGDIAILFS